MKKLIIPFSFVLLFLAFSAWMLVSDALESQYRRGYEQGSYDMGSWAQSKGYEGDFPSFSFRNHLMETKPGAQNSEELMDIYKKYSKGEL